MKKRNIILKFLMMFSAVCGLAQNSSAQDGFAPLLPPDLRYMQCVVIPSITTSGYDRSEVNRLTALIEKNPENFELYMRRGVFQEESKALSDFDKAVSLNPKSALAYLYRAKFYEYTDENKVIADTTKAIALEPNLAVSYALRATAYNENKQFQKAAADFSRAIKLNSNYTDAYNGRGAVYCQAGNYAAAIKDFSKAISINNENVNFLRNRLNAYLKLKNYRKAIEDSTAIINLYGENANDYEYNHRGEIYLKAGEAKKAVADFTKAIELGAGSYTYLNRADAYKILKEYDKAVADYTEAIKLSPEDYYGYQKRGEIYLITGKRQLAAKDFAKAKKLKRY